MPIRFRCECGSCLAARDECAGRQSKCPKCGAAVRVPFFGAEFASSDDDELVGEILPDGTIKFACTCGKRVRAKKHQVGRRVGCPRCSKVLVVPQPDGAGIPTVAPTPQLAPVLDSQPTRPEPPSIPETPGIPETPAERDGPIRLKADDEETGEIDIIPFADDDK